MSRPNVSISNKGIKLIDSKQAYLLLLYHCLLKTNFLSVFVWTYTRAFLVICLALLGVILLATLVVILFANLLRELCSQWYYIRLVIFSARSAYHLRSKYHAFTHITRRKANITEKSRLLSQSAFFLAGAQGLEPWTPSFGDWCSTDWTTPLYFCLCIIS